VTVEVAGGRSSRLRRVRQAIFIQQRIQRASRLNRERGQAVGRGRRRVLFAI
jgi:hypothetical protein